MSLDQTLLSRVLKDIWGNYLSDAVTVFVKSSIIRAFKCVTDDLADKVDPLLLLTVSINTHKDHLHPWVSTVINSSES